MADQRKDSQHRRPPRKRRRGGRQLQVDHRGADGVRHEVRGAYWLYGRHAVLAALANPNRRCHRLVIASQQQETLETEATAAMQNAGAPRPKLEVRDGTELSSLLPKGAVHQGIAVQVEPITDIGLPAAIAAAPENATILVLDQASDPHNIGAVLRSAAAFDAAFVVCQARNAPGETGVLAKAASGALEIVPLISVTNVVRALIILKAAGFWCLGLDGEADNVLDASRLTDKTALILGAEGAGLRRLTRESCDDVARIAMSPRMESLNVSNAAAICLHQAFQRHKE